MLLPALALACVTGTGATAVGAAPPPAGACPQVTATGGEAWPGQRRWQRLEEAGYRLGELDVAVRDVYTGASLPWYQRWANALHIDTDPAVIHDLLTVAPGDAVDAARIYEAERTLRDQPFLTAARIVPTACADGYVAAEVRVRDAWTLRLSAGVGHAGGESSSSTSIQEDNLLGTGKSVFVSWEDDADRTTLEYGYSDPALLGSWWTLDLSHRDLSDGRGDAVELAYPFRRVDQAWGLRVAVDDARNDIDFEQSGETAFTTQADLEQARLELQRLVASGTQGGWRAGVGWRYDDADYGPLEEVRPDLRPAPVLGDRRLRGPFLSLERFDDRYRSFRNLRAIGRTEDYGLGLEAYLAGGRYTESDGPDDPWFFELRLRHGLALGERDLLLTRVNVEGRYREDGGRAAYYRSVGADYYHRSSRRNTVVLHGEYDRRDDPDPEDELYLGGFDGLLAYPDRFRVGDRRWRLHLENRYVSDLVLFDTIQVGYTAYLEAGSIRGLDGRWGRTLADAGAGLRLGSLRSSFGVVSYLTVAVPLVDAGDHDDYSFVVGSTVSF